jgi:hypothetical protein
VFTASRKVFVGTESNHPFEPAVPVLKNIVLRNGIVSSHPQLTQLTPIAHTQAENGSGTVQKRLKNGDETA